MHMIGVPDIARSQQGVFTAEQALEAGFTARQIRRRQAGGEWVRVAGRGLAEREPPGPSPSPVPAGHSPWALAWAAQLTWPEVVACRRSAAVVHGFPVRPGREAEVVGGRPRRAVAGIRPVPGDGPPPGQVCVVGGLRVTDRRRTALDCLAFLPFDEALDLYVWLWARHEIPREQIVAAVQGRIGRPGCVQLRRLLAVTRSGPVSGAGYRLQRLLKASGLEGWTPGGPASGLADPAAASEVTFPRARLVVAVRTGPAQGLRPRDRALGELGFAVLPATPGELSDAPAAVVSKVRHALSVRHRVRPSPARSLP